MRVLHILLISMILTTSGCLSSVEDTINPEQELFDDTVFIDEDEHIKLLTVTDTVAMSRQHCEAEAIILEFVHDIDLDDNMWYLFSLL